MSWPGKAEHWNKRLSGVERKKKETEDPRQRQHVLELLEVIRGTKPRVDYIHVQFYLAKFRRSDWLKGVQEEDLINLVPLNVESVPKAVLSFGVFVCLFVLNFK